MEKMTITINGKTVEARPDQTILEVVQEHRLDDIPTLCHDPKLPPYGSCYLCVVEVQGQAKLIPACSSPVTTGMVLVTNNERIRKARRTALELLLSNHYADCLAPCKLTCPAGVDVQGYIALMAQGRHHEAVRLIKETNPLPLVCGRVCVRECELACRRNRVDDRVGIDYLKRYAADIDIEEPWTPQVPERNGKKVAVVGGGPAGLTCAYYLILKGYGVTLFEKAPALGGMLRYGIPEYRLPKALLDKEINWITDLGVEVRLEKEMGRDFSLEDLRRDHDAVFLAFGAQKAKAMRIPEEEKTAGVVPGIDFLQRLQSASKPELFGRVVVVGGGNTAIDAARSAVRLGAEKVIVLYRRTRKEMPAHEMEIEAALHEGIELIELSAPTRIISTAGRLKALECIRMGLGDPDESGRRSPVPKPGSEYQLPCDFAISAIGQDVDLCGVDKASGLKASRWSTPVISEDTLEASLPAVFVGGDMATGPDVAIAAIAHGKIAANSIDHYLNNCKAAGKPWEFLSKKDDFGEIPDSEFIQHAKIAKESMPELPAGDRIRGFVEVETGFSERQMANEASRCLECGCSAYFDCDLRKLATEFNVQPAKFLGEVRKYKVDKHHPFITLDPNKCIACGRCVRTCSEILRVSALGFVYRGFRAIVRPSLEKKLLQTNCISCGNCISACPTGAISEKLPFPKQGPWQWREAPSICNFCSAGCHLKFRILNADIFTVGSAANESPNKGYLCHKGRFGYRYMLDGERAVKPLVRKGNRLVESSWKEALGTAAEKISQLVAARGGQAMAISASPRLSNEELYLLQRLARSGLGSNQLASFSRLLGNPERDSLKEIVGITASSATLDDLLHAGVILVVNAELTDENLIAELRVKEAQRKGARLVTIASYESKLVKDSDLWIDCKRGTSAILIAALAQELIAKGAVDQDFIASRTSGYAEFRKSLSGLGRENAALLTGVDARKIDLLSGWIAEPNANLLVVYNQDHLWENARQDLQAVGDLLLLTGRFGRAHNGILLLSHYANSQGLLDMGMDSRFLPGQFGEGQAMEIERIGKAWKTDLKQVFKSGNYLETLLSGSISGLLVVGEDPLAAPENLRLLANISLLVVADYCLTPTAQAADVFIPLSLPIESDGTYTACDRRVQKVDRLFSARSGKENWQWMLELAKKMKAKLHYKSVADVYREIQRVNPDYSEVPFTGGTWGADLFAESFRTADRKGHFQPLGLEMSPASRQTPVLLSSEKYLIREIKSKLVV